MRLLCLLNIFRGEQGDVVNQTQTSMRSLCLLNIFRGEQGDVVNQTQIREVWGCYVCGIYEIDIGVSARGKRCLSLRYK